MKVMFQGAHSSNNEMIQACCVAAIMSAAKYNRKTLILQLTGANSLDAEKYMIGKSLDEEVQTNEKEEIYRIDNKGIDALIMRAATAKLTKDHFDSSCKPILKYENMLDIAGMSKKDDFVDNLTVKEISIILKYADDVYDNVFLILDGKNQLVMQEILELCDVYVTCLAQTPRKETFNTFEGKRMLHLVTNYDHTSAYSALYLKKQYKARKLYILRQNTEFKDSCLEGTLLRFMLKNVNNTSGDDNYAFMKNVTELMDGIMDKENWAEAVVEAEDLDSTDFPREDEPEPLEKVDPDEIVEESVIEKKGFFGKKREKTRIRLRNKDTSDMPAKKKKSKGTVEEVGSEESEEIYEDPVNEDAYEEFYEEEDELEEEFEEPPEEEEPVKEEKIPVPEVKLKPVTQKSPAKKNSEKENSSVKMKAPAMEPKAETVAPDNTWTCHKCGEVNTKQFCAVCGTKKQVGGSWICPECGAENTGMFCEDCGTGKP